jgi:4-diphosphocytidyl-2-C-methyl-D-erythritol kinase
MAATARAFVLMARAKFNLRLDVGALRADGLHDVRSVVAELLVADELVFLPSESGFRVSCDDLSIAESENLALRAANALGIDLPSIHILIKKRLPVEAGLGGGSADAATALRGLVAALAETGVTVSHEAMLAAAARVGSDVPACLIPGLKLVEGAGEKVRPIVASTPHWGLLLLKPAIGVPTATAYRLLDDARAAGGDLPRSVGGSIEELCDAIARGDFGRVCALAHNDLQRPVEAAHPFVAAARLRLVSAGAATTILCGSGSCVAGLFENVAEAQKALALVRPARGEWAAATGFAHGR